MYCKGGTTMPMEMFSIRLDSDVKEQLELLALEDSRKLSEYIRNILSDHLAKQNGYTESMLKAKRLIKLVRGSK
jgi:predicted transcriptional regulator